MDNLKELSNNEIIELIKKKEVGAKELTDSGICPTCFDKLNNYILYGDNKDKMIYEDDKYECFLAGNPRSIGHAIVSTKNHYKDMMEIDDEICKEIFVLAKHLMNNIKDVYKCESVYLCTMCDGPMNHFHLQLIPRYDYENRGSKNFVKERHEYIENKELLEELRNRMKRSLL